MFTHQTSSSETLKIFFSEEVILPKVQYPHLTKNGYLSVKAKRDFQVYIGTIIRSNLFINNFYFIRNTAPRQIAAQKYATQN